MTRDAITSVSLWGVLVFSGVMFSNMVSACEPVDFYAVGLPARLDQPIKTALELAYPDLRVTGDPTVVILPGGAALPLETMREIAPKDMLFAPTIAEQFVYTYPLGFDLARRLKPFQDPGRLRNAAFFQALYFSDPYAARASLRSIPLGSLGEGNFTVTRKHGVDCQLEAVLSHLKTLRTDHTPFFRSLGGSFNWRRIAGADRLSTHSFGIAVDLNVDLGGYWRWSAAREGHVGQYDNRMPADLVAAFERYGFIWGGKWHHYDGMHFEYRPELILYSRLSRKEKKGTGRGIKR